MILKTSKKTVSSDVFWYVKIYPFWNFIQYTIHWDKTQAQRSTSIRITEAHWSTRIISLKLWVRFWIFNSVLLLLKFLFFSTKSMDSLNLKRHNSFQSKNKTEATYSFAPGPLIFMLQQEIWEFNAGAGAPQNLTWRQIF